MINFKWHQLPEDWLKCLIVFKCLTKDSYCIRPRILFWPALKSDQYCCYRLRRAWYSQSRVSTLDWLFCHGVTVVLWFWFFIWARETRNCENRSHVQILERQAIPWPKQPSFDVISCVRIGLCCGPAEEIQTQLGLYRRNICICTKMYIGAILVAGSGMGQRCCARDDIMITDARLGRHTRMFRLIFDVRSLWSWSTDRVRFKLC